MGNKLDIMNNLLTSVIIVLIVSSMTSSIILPAYADGKKTSIFKKIENFIKEPFLSLEKAVGGDGHKRPHSYQQPDKLKPFLSSWICQLIIGDVGKIVDASNKNTNDAQGWCKGNI